MLLHLRQLLPLPERPQPHKLLPRCLPRLQPLLPRYREMQWPWSSCLPRWDCRRDLISHVSLRSLSNSSNVSGLSANTAALQLCSNRPTMLHPVPRVHASHLCEFRSVCARVLSRLSARDSRRCAGILQAPRCRRTSAHRSVGAEQCITSISDTPTVACRHRNR